MTEVAREYAILTGAERDATILNVLKRINEPLRVSGAARAEDWERGWQEILDEYRKTGDKTSLIPPYIRRALPLRKAGEYIQPVADDFESTLLDREKKYVFQKWFSFGISRVYEYGCGTGLNILKLHEMCPWLELTGIDWADASGEIIKEIDVPASFLKDDMFSPTASLEPDSGVLTMVAMEQLGVQWQPLFEHLLSQSPKVVVHIEPLYELYDQSQLFGYLGAAYSDKRGYLRGYLPALESDDRVEILEVKQGFGSLMHDSYSRVVWRPKERP
jgi:SAM-dependent methyltransferase